MLTLHIANHAAFVTWEDLGAQCWRQMIWECPDRCVSRGPLLTMFANFARFTQLHTYGLLCKPRHGRIDHGRVDITYIQHTRPNKPSLYRQCGISTDQLSSLFSPSLNGTLPLVFLHSYFSLVYIWVVLVCTFNQSKVLKFRSVYEKPTTVLFLY